jgi:two-component system, LytTR family, response regulator
MTKFKCLIVDDEAPAHEVIIAHIYKTDNLEVAGRAYNGKEALDFLMQYKVDIVFLDIDMPKLTGMELLDCIPYKPSIILVTAYNNFAFEAYQKDVIDYLLKPVSYSRFLKAIHKIPTVQDIPQPIIHYPIIDLKVDGIIEKIDTQSILFIESIGNYIKIFLTEGKPIIVQQTMKFLESILPNEFFIRIHKSYLINKKSILKRSKEEITITNDKILPIGRKFSILLDKIDITN